MAQRLYFIDRIRVVLTALVVFHHAAVTYGVADRWYYLEQPPHLTLTSILFAVFLLVNQSYFMGFFFFLAGYFSPGAYDRKGLWRFTCDRALRLGIPLLVFGLVLTPLTVAISLDWGRPAATSLPFLPEFLFLLKLHHMTSGTLWFVEGLILFSAGYIGWRVLQGSSKPAPRQMDAPMPTNKGWLLSALGVGVGALLLRQRFHADYSTLGLPLGYFSSYTFLFILGTVAYRRNWLERLTWKTARVWVIASVLAIPLFPLSLLGELHGHHVIFVTGHSREAILHAFWEPFVAWGVIAAYLIWFREHANRPSRVWEHLGACAYGIYIVHTPVLVAFCVLLRPWSAPAMAKFAVTGSLGFAGSLLVASALLKIPGAHRIL